MRVLVIGQSNELRSHVPRLALFQVRLQARGDLRPFGGGTRTGILFGLPSTNGVMACSPSGK